MTCVHLRKLYQLCQDNKLKLSGADLIHIICEECGEKEVCPSVLTDEYDQTDPSAGTSTAPDAENSAGPPGAERPSGD